MIQYQSAVLFVRDIAAARHFYEDLLGQEVEMDFGPNVGFKSGLSIWQVDHAYQIIFENPEQSDVALGRANLELYFEAADLQAEWDRLVAAGVRTAQPIHEQPWGQRAFRIYDPDFHLIELGEPMPVVVQRMLDAGLSLEQTAQRTGMPIDVVQNMA